MSPQPRHLFSLLLTLALLSPALASAQDLTETRSPVAPAVGVRVGGYGFRQLNAEGTLLNWENCRMNGVGVFGGVDLSSRLYSELSLDMYHATATPLRQGIDRLSLHTQGLVGYRIPLWKWLTPNFHLGGGAEFTRVEVFGQQDRAIKPVGFIGIGGELNLGDLRFGMSTRVNAMQLPVYQWNPGTNDDASDAGEITYETEVAGQMLFSVRYML